MTDQPTRRPDEINEETGFSDEAVLNNLTLLEINASANRGKSISEIKGIAKEQIESIYAIALQLYEAENYEDALPLFQVLSLYNAREEKYILGLAGCLQELGKYELAAKTFAGAASLSNFNNPQAMYFSAFNLMKSNQKAEAIVTLQYILLKCNEGDQEYNMFKNRAAKMLALLQQNEQK